MSKIIKLKKGLDIKLLGEATRKLTKLPLAGSYGVVPGDFKGITPKLLVKADDTVKAGTPLFFDKYRPEVVFTSPVSGRVAAVNRGEKRRILDVVITPDAEQVYETFDVSSVETASREEVISLLVKSGLWPMIIQRPYGIIADPLQAPKAIFISGFDSSPLAPDMNFVLDEEHGALNAAFGALAKLTDGKIHLSMKAASNGVLNRVPYVEQHFFDGPHPAGNVGVQIHHIDPVNKGDIVWTVDIQHMAIIGRFLRTGKVDMTKTIALAGSEVENPQYVKVISGVAVSGIVDKSNIRKQEDGGKVRIISGNVLTGYDVGKDGYLGFYDNQITVVPEGDKSEFVGWALPRLGKYSVSHTYFTWLMSMVCPKKEYAIDTNLHGGQRAFVMTGVYDKYLPMDIYPLYLVKAALAGDIDKMENLGIYEVIEDDLALCEFVDPSKNNIQQIIRDGINLLIKELN